MSENRYQDTTPTNPYHEAPQQPVTDGVRDDRRDADVRGERVAADQQRLDAEPLDAAPGADPVAADAADDVLVDREVTDAERAPRGNSAGLVDNAQNDGLTR